MFCESELVEELFEEDKVNELIFDCIDILSDKINPLFPFFSFSFDIILFSFFSFILFSISLIELLSTFIFSLNSGLSLEMYFFF